MDIFDVFDGKFEPKKLKSSVEKVLLAQNVNIEKLAKSGDFELNLDIFSH